MLKLVIQFFITLVYKKYSKHANISENKMFLDDVFSVLC